MIIPYHHAAACRCVSSLRRHLARSCQAAALPLLCTVQPIADPQELHGKVMPACHVTCVQSQHIRHFACGRSFCPTPHALHALHQPQHVQDR